MEMQQAFNIMNARTAAVLIERGYKKEEVAESDKEITSLYTGENAYSIVYDIAKKRVALKTCGMEDDEPDNNWKTLATWIFDPETDDVREAENISEDFAEAIRGPKQTKAQLKKKKKDSDTNVDSLFFANRMVSFFPELKDEIAYEKAHYEIFRGVTFAEEKILPKFVPYAENLKGNGMEKFSQTLFSLYSNGDLDVKGIITYILFNAIEDDGKFEELISGFDENTKKIARAARNLRGKKIKPEKPKKKNKYLASMLEGIEQQ